MSDTQRVLRKVQKTSVVTTSKSKADLNYVHAVMLKAKLKRFDTEEFRQIQKMIAADKRAVVLLDKLWMDACWRILGVRVPDRKFSMIREATGPIIRKYFKRVLQWYRPRGYGKYMPMDVIDHVIKFV